MAKRDIRKDVRWAYSWTLYYAVAASHLVLGVYVFGGSAALEQRGVTLSTALISYVVAGAITGPVLAVLRPITAYWWGAILTGVVIASIVVAILGVGYNGIAFWLTEANRLDIRKVLFFSVLAAPGGGAAGLGSWWYYYVRRHAWS